MFDPPDPIDPDDLLMAEISDLYGRTDPVPAAVTTAAYAAIEFRDLDAQLAELLSDSALEDRELAGVRGSASATRLLTFALGDEQYVEVDVTSDGERRSLTGYVVPGAAGHLTVDHPGGTAQAELDDQGRFSLDGIHPGPIRLRLAIPGRAPIATEWLSV